MLICLPRLECLSAPCIFHVFVESRELIFLLYRLILFQRRPSAVPGHAKPLTNHKFWSFSKKKWCSRSSFELRTNVSANLLVLVARRVGIPQLGLQRHLASKGLSKASKGSQGGRQEFPREAQWLNFHTVGWKRIDYHIFFASYKAENFKMQK